MSAPIVFQWSGEAMVPLRRFAKACDDEFIIGQTYQMVVQEERSAKTHAHYFASVTEAWKNLPDQIAEQFPTAHHLRKHALIRKGFRVSTEFACSSKAEAVRLAPFIGAIDDYAIVTVDGNIVTRHVAKSQNMRSMDKATFAASKVAVLEWVSDLIGTTPEALIAARAA